MMKFARRGILLGSLTTMLTSVWSRIIGAPRLPAPAPSARPTWPTDVVSKLYRDMYRRLIDPDAFDAAFDRATAVLRASIAGKIDCEEAITRLLAIRSEALRHPPPPREIAPLRADEVGVHEAMALLRRAIVGESHIELKYPWAEVFHSYGQFAIEGWKLTAFKRNYGIKYLDAALSPDGRTGTYDSWQAREGNPVHLLLDEEQDRLDELIEGIDA
ncbi:hypothetical protein XH99_29530 [Bradyrhizobium nanningense]|uniref:DUF7693 domain-containing protein n=1 Tax=Bradyrhizobium nanningense TaxID=1325118 RepID=A0A4Q0RZ81_9BRAD|nr:hypothetical protein [Bradyrhizobium nanningense]RXH24205.1 hypothetical protein XH99_29530 [Bradyrhizobium nanningense]RXH29239.1 hypothetical protein XH84_22255 [Bradyrhizobium nanningense]